MQPADRLPPITESGFRRKYFRIWLILGVACTIAGLALGPRLNHSWNPWFSIVVAFGLYFFSVLLCGVILISVWRRPSVSPPMLFFSIPVGGAGLSLILFMRAIGPTYLFMEPRNLVGMSLAIILLYAGSLVWGILVGISRKRLGDIRTDSSSGNKPLTQPHRH